MCIVSDCLKHDTVTVHAFIATMLSHLKTVKPSIKKVVYFSDGAASQYKNYKNFTNLQHHKQDFGLNAEWHFFATSHGKSPCDGIGGTVKRLVARASLQATLDNHILTATDLYKWASAHIAGVKFSYVSAGDVTMNATKFSLYSRFESAKTFPGTRSHHCFIPVSEVELRMKRISADDDSTSITFSDQTVSLSNNQSHPPQPDQLQPGKYIACIYDREWYVGNIVQHSQEHHDVLVDFMKHSGKGLLSWPSAAKKDCCWVPFQHVICVIDAPEPQGNSARSYKLSTRDITLIQEKLPSFLD